MSLQYFVFSKLYKLPPNFTSCIMQISVNYQSSISTQFIGFTANKSFIYLFSFDYCMNRNLETISKFGKQ